LQKAVFGKGQLETVLEYALAVEEYLLLFRRVATAQVVMQRVEYIDEERIEVFAVLTEEPKKFLGILDLNILVIEQKGLDGLDEVADGLVALGGVGAEVVKGEVDQIEVAQFVVELVLHYFVLDYHPVQQIDSLLLQHNVTVGDVVQFGLAIR
jgi:hypothetical protein